jgi:broad specificity phosphatase PhoE
MHKAILVFLMVLTCTWPTVDVSAQQSVIVIRHGEKRDATADPALSKSGQARAQRLAKLLAVSKVTAIYTTQYKRTMLHAAPTAKRLGITPVVIAASDADALLAAIRGHGVDDVVLVVGHSNTVPAILSGLGHSAAATIDDETFDDLFIVAMKAGGAPTVVHLKY